MKHALLLFSLAVVVGMGLPGLLGAGVDVPDDTLYFDVAGWEWLATAARTGANPWWVPGKLGGVSLFGDVVAMGPFHPAAWSGLLLPVGFALPLWVLLHAIALLLAIRWFARVAGARPDSATLAGLAVAAGPLGAMGFVDGRAAAWAGLVAVPLILGALERSKDRDDVRWAALAGAALAMALLGSHVRVAACVGAVAALWVPLRGLHLRLAWPLAAGVLVGAPGFVPTLLEARQAAASLSRVELLAAPAQTGLSWDNLGGLFAARTSVAVTDYGVGAVLLLGALAAVGGPDGLRRRLGLLLALLAAAAAATELPGARWVLAPLLVLSHPVNDLWSAIAVVPLSILGALGLDRILAGAVSWRGPRGAAAVGLLALAPLPFVLDDPALATDRATGLFAAGLLAAALAAASLLSRRRALIVAAAALELAAVGVRFHFAAPSPPLDVAARLSTPGLDDLAAGSLDVRDLELLEPFTYTAGALEQDGDLAHAEDADWEAVAAQVREDVLERRWPAHVAVSAGYRGLAGLAKMAPERQVAMLLPVAEALQRGDAPDTVFGPNRAGRHLLQHAGIPLAVRDDQRWTADAIAPDCWVPTAVVVDDDRDRRVESLLARPFDPRIAVVESEPAPHAGAARVTCDGDRVQADADADSLVVLNRPWHPGWRSTVPLIPVDQIHLGALVPVGRSEFELEFVPPGLRPAGGASLLGLLGLATALRTRRRSRPT